MIGLLWAKPFVQHSCLQTTCNNKTRATGPEAIDSWLRGVVRVRDSTHHYQWPRTVCLAGYGKTHVQQPPKALVFGCAAFVIFACQPPPCASARTVCVCVCECAPAVFCRNRTLRASPRWPFGLPASISQLGPLRPPSCFDAYLDSCVMCLVGAELAVMIR